jgi:hypothetical protein
MQPIDAPHATVAAPQKARVPPEAPAPPRASDLVARTKVVRTCPLACSRLVLRRLARGRTSPS